MAVSNTNLLEFLGKQVSFSFVGGGGITYETDGVLSSIVFHLHGSPQFCLDNEDCNYFSFDKVLNFEVGTITKSPSAIDDHSIVDAAFTGLITDNKDFIDSLSK